MQYIVALDQGTTSSRAIVIDQNGQPIASHSIEFAQHYPQPGWVEHDPFDILQTQTDSLRIAVQKAGVTSDQIAAIGITNQRETTIVWERATGKPIYNAIVWQCRRTASLIEQLKADGLFELVQQKTGLVPDAYFSATKLQWLFQTMPELLPRAAKGELCFGTVDSWLLYNLSSERVHATDATNASRTMLYNLETGDWDDELLRLFNVPRAMLPRIVDTSGVVGMLRADILGREIPIASMVGDQQGALFGQACFYPGMVKNTYGTGCFLLMPTGQNIVHSRNRLLTTVALQMNGVREYALEGSIFVGGAVVQWLRDEMKMLETSAQSEEVARSVPNSLGVYVVPAFTGLGAPYWDMYGRGTIVGLTRGAGRAHIVRAALEAIAFQTRDVVEAMQDDVGIRLPQMRVDGGASANGYLMQFQSDILDTRVVRPRVIETTAMGAAFLAGLAVGVWSDRSQLEALWQSDQTFSPSMPDAERETQYRGWQRAVQRAASWALYD